MEALSTRERGSKAKSVEDEATDNYVRTQKTWRSDAKLPKIGDENIIRQSLTFTGRGGGLSVVGSRVKKKSRRLKKGRGLGPQCNPRNKRNASHAGHIREAGPRRGGTEKRRSEIIRRPLWDGTAKIARGQVRERIGMRN